MPAADSEEKAPAQPGSARADETTSLVRPKEKSWLGWWRNRTTAQFKFATLYSARVSFWVVIIAIVPLSFARGRAMFASHGFNVAYILCNFLFTVGPDVGSSIQNSIYAVLGNFYSGAMLWMLNGIFPGGYIGTNDLAWWVGVVCSILFIWLFMWLNVNETVRFFALYSYVSYAMTFINPNLQSGVSANFNINFKGTAVNAVLLSILGAICAILCSLLPYPVTATHKLRISVREMRSATMKVSRNVLEYYCGNKQCLQIFELQSELNTIKDMLVAARSAEGPAWFESFGFGRRGRSRGMIARHFDMLNEIILRMDPLFTVVRREGFEDSHKQIMVHIKKQLIQTSDKVETVAEKCMEATMYGQVGPAEQQELEKHSKELKQLVSDLGIAVAQGKTVNKETTGEQSFIYTQCVIAQLVIKRAEEVADPNDLGDERVAPAMLKAQWVSMFDDCFDLSHLGWSIRNFLSIMICFVIGLNGAMPGCADVSVRTDAACFIVPYNANISSVVVVLLSKFIGSEFKAGLDRVAAVVLANVAGQMGWVLFGWCNPLYRLLTAIFVFFLVLPMMYIAYNGGEYSSLGMRVAAIGAMAMMAPCSNDFLTHRDYSQAYHAVIDTVVGVFVMLLVDLALSGEAPSVQAEAIMMDSIKRFQKAFGELLTSSKDSKYVITEAQAILANVETATAMAKEAEKEPRFWRPDWRKDLFHSLCSCFACLSRELSNLATAMGEEESATALLKNSQKFKSVCNDLITDVGYLIDVAAFVLMNQQIDSMRVPCELARDLKHEAGTKHLIDMSDLIADINEQVEKLTPRSRSNVALQTQISMVVETIVSIHGEVRVYQHKIICHRNC